MFKLLLTCFTLTATLYSYSQDSTLVTFPIVRLLRMDSTNYITNKDLKENTNTIFINFSPTCDHCQRTIADILKHIEKFKGTQVVFTSFESFNALRKFYTDNYLDKYPSVFIGQEQRLELTKQLKYSSFPCSVIFDNTNRWIRTIEGEAKAKEYLRILHLK